MKFVKTLIFGSLLLALLCSQTPEDLLVTAESQIEMKEFSLAVQTLQQAIDLDPTFAPAAFKLALVFLRTGDMQKSQSLFRQAIDVDPENQEYRDEFDRINEINSLMGEGKRFMNSGELDEAYDIFDKVMTQFPFFANAAYSMGGVKIVQKQYEVAIKHFRQALEIYPEFSNAQSAIKTVIKNMYNDGNTLYKRGDLEGAVEAYEKVIEFDSTFYQACYQIGVISTRMGDIDQAIAYYKKALNILPTYTKGWYALGLAQKRDTDPENAVISFQRAIDVDPTYARAYVAIGEIFLNRQEYENAIDKFQIAISVQPDYAKAYENLGITYTRLEQWADAITQLEIAVQFNPKSLTGWYHLAESFNKTSDCENALRCARQAIDVKANYAPALIEQGVAYWCKGIGDKTRALNALEKARNDGRWRKVAEYEIDRIKNPDKYKE
ncbi:MAG: tetratricopeptide repeat protein [Candidatus Marinimicrobia bacterium]|nr:tetratricopeptide repeat protein [Candidatus Neomarinimicrobiota bacterium]